MHPLLEKHAEIIGPNNIFALQQLANQLKGLKIVHINSTKEGGGVAEILAVMVPLAQALDLNMHWEVIQGDANFYQCTKLFHNALQGIRGSLHTPEDLEHFEKINAENAERLRPILQDADVVIIHDPQPVALIDHFPNHKGKWVWRCHIDASNPARFVWNYLKKFIVKYNAAIFSLEEFTHPLPIPMHIISPSIDALSEKNMPLSEEEVLNTYRQFGLDFSKPKLLQVSRFDRFKDPLGVIRAYKMAKKFYPNMQLILAGGGATDDPEGTLVYNEVILSSKGDPDVHVLLLPPTAHRTINALQRGADIILQKSIREGFGLTVTEALWKGKAVIGGNTGGIRLQVINHHTGFLVNTPEGAAMRIRYLLQYPQIARELGTKGKLFVRENFLITRQLRDYLALFATFLFPDQDSIYMQQ